MSEKNTKTLIPDVNGNDVLDGEDLLASLHAEAKSGQRSDTRRVLEALGVEGLADEVGDEAIQKGSYDGLMELAASMFSGRLAELKGKGPEYWRQQHALVGEEALSATEKKQAHRDLDLAKQFIADLDKTFPGGVNIAAGDMREVLGHFGELPVPGAGYSQNDPGKGGRGA